MNNNNTMGILICKRESKFVIGYYSDERIAFGEYELVWLSKFLQVFFVKFLKKLWLPKILV